MDNFSTALASEFQLLFLRDFPAYAVLGCIDHLGCEITFLNLNRIPIVSVNFGPDDIRVRRLPVTDGEKEVYQREFQHPLHEARRLQYENPGLHEQLVASIKDRLAESWTSSELSNVSPWTGIGSG